MRHMSTERWASDSFLNELRSKVDVLAEECLRQLREGLEKHNINKLFRLLDANDIPLPSDGPEPLKTFLKQSSGVPLVDGRTVDRERLKRGQRVFMTHAFPCALVLLTKSLPEGYAAPNLAKILHTTRGLLDDTYRRLLGVLQLVVNVCSVGGFEPEGKAIITISKIRLLHAAIRRQVCERLPNYEGQINPSTHIPNGKPVNLEDMLGTVMGFSYLVIVGLEQLNIPLTGEEKEDFYYLWRVFAQMMGIHPENDPDNSLYVPADLDEAGLFYDSYRRRHYVESSQNSEGVELAKANLDMLNELLPQTPLRRLGLKIVPRIYMEDLIGPAGCARIGIKPVFWLPLTKWFFLQLPGMWSNLWHAADRTRRSSRAHEKLSQRFFQRVINTDNNGEITFRIPPKLEELRQTKKY
jgi:hypothetical protein